MSDTPTSTELEHDARVARDNGMWFNSAVPRPGIVRGPVSGDAMTTMVAFDGARAAVAERSARRVEHARYVHTGFECGAL